MEEKELISKLQTLKQIRPNQNWVVLTKNQILGQSAPVKAARPSYIPNIFDIIFQRKLAYAMAVLLIVLIGAYSLVNFISFQQVNNSKIALLAAEAELKNNFRIMGETSKSLKEAIESEPQKIDQAVEEAKVAVKNTTELIKKEPSLAKTVAAEAVKNRTYLNIAGREDFNEVNDAFYKTTLEALFDYYEEVSMLQEQRQAFELIRDSYNKGEIVPAVGLELILQVVNSSGE